MNPHTGKIVHSIDCSVYSESDISCLGWAINFTESSKVTHQLQSLGHEVSLEEIINRNPQIKALDTVPDLPSDLAFLDVETSLPKLSPLSSGGIE